MKLANVARHFDRLACVDAYTPGVPFYGQFNLFDDSTRDGLTIERRILSVVPGVSIPARRVIRADGLNWMVGDYAPDYFRGAAIRYKYILHQAQGLATLKTIAEALQGAPGVQAYVATAWVKGSKELEVSSGIFDVFTVYAAAGEPLLERTLVSLGGRWYLIRGVYGAMSGLQAAIVDELVEPALETASFISRTYAPVTDTYAESASAVQALRVRWQSHFDYISSASETYQRGDCQVMVLKTVTPNTADEVTLSDGTWRVLSVLDEGAYWSLHMRRA